MKVSKFYKSSDRFTCISNPSIHVPLASLNDDYCDCPDGSDEPGTAACAQLSRLSPAVSVFKDEDNTILALPGFYCKNKGHNPAYTPFYRVNDGVCDYDTCCDGSDEWAGVGGVKCPDKCREIGVEWRQQDEKRKLSAIAASKRRTEMVMEARKARAETEEWLKKAVSDMAALEEKAKTLEKEKNEVEYNEQRKLVKREGDGGKIAVLSNLAKGRLAVLKEGIRDVRGMRDTYKGRVAELEGLLAKFKEQQQSSGDEKIVGIITEWDNYNTKDRGQAENDAQERDWEEMINGSDEIAWEDFDQDDTEGDIEVRKLRKAYLHPRSHGALLTDQQCTASKNISLSF